MLNGDGETRAGDVCALLDAAGTLRHTQNDKTQRVHGWVQQKVTHAFVASKLGASSTGHR